MASDFTAQQTPADQQRSQDLSLQRTRPPLEIPGYEIERFLGAGAYGEVWVGVDRTTGRKVAIKFYLHRHGVDWSLLAREVEKLRFLSADRYVVQLLDVGWEADPPYYVMEYVEAGSLDALLRRDGPLPVPEAVELFREIAIGLARAHGKGVVHCDLKPANILLDQDHRPRLADFGQSRLSHEQKPALGTLFYMAPEQADLHALADVRWDVYALGAILYTLLVGSPPHRNDEAVSWIDAASDLEQRLARYRQTIRTAPPPAEHRRVPGVDRALAEIIDRCLAANPDDRFANVQEVLDALAARTRNRARLPLVVLGFVGPLLVLLVTALFSYRGYVRAVDNAQRGYSEWALRNNQFVAQLAAEKVTAQIGRYFQLAQQEAAAPELQSLFFALIDHSPALEKLVRSDTPSDAYPELRAQFRHEPARLRLERHLAQRLEAYQQLAQRDRRVPRFASLFVTDRHGTQLASVFDDASVSQAIGHNWAHRTYFHGGPAELPPFDRPPADPPHIQRTHLSAVFRSTTQNTWKVAISTPIQRLAGDEWLFAGILVLTVELGDFDISVASGTPPGTQFLVLADARDGEERGTILHHPLFHDLAEHGKTVPQVLLGRDYRVPDALLRGQPLADYRDPLARYTGDGGLAARYDRRWLAASAPVLPPLGAGDHSASGLVVLVQSDYQTVVQPAQELGGQFIRNSFGMVAVMVTISLSLWYVAVRMLHEGRAGRARPANSPHATALLEASTLPPEAPL
jgi:hypothetical protein